MRRFVRPAVALSGLALAVAATGAHAATTGPQTLTFADPAGDNVSPSASSDITGVTFSTKGTGTGKKYVPTSLLLTMTLSGPPTSDGTTIYSIDTNLVGCGDLYLQYTPGAKLGDTFNYADCGSAPDATGSTGTSFGAAPEARGNTLVWRIPFKNLPTKVTVGSEFTALNAYTDFIDPATGIFGPASLTGTPLYDTAETPKSYTVG